MAEQATGINMYMEHKYTDETTLGPVVEAQIRDNTLWVKGRVRKSKTDKVNDILEAGTYMGGSFGGICQKDYINKAGSRMLDKVNLLDATFTPMPVNTATRGTATMKDCTVCGQIFKSLEHKYNVKQEIDEKKVNNIDSDKIDKSKSTMEDKTMDENEINQIKELLVENNKSLVEAITETLKEPEPAEPEPEPEPEPAKEINKDELIQDVTQGLIKALGINTEPEPEPDDNKIVIMNQKTLEEHDNEIIQKALKTIAKKREGTRQSKSLGGPKFMTPTDTQTEPEKVKGKVSTRKAAELLAEKKGLA